MFSVICPEAPETFTESSSAITSVPARLTRTRLISPVETCLPLESSTATLRRKFTWDGGMASVTRLNGTFSATLQEITVRCCFCCGAAQEPNLDQAACCSCRL